jgi:hypothetical protein
MEENKYGILDNSCIHHAKNRDEYSMDIELFDKINSTHIPSIKFYVSDLSFDMDTYVNMVISTTKDGKSEVFIIDLDDKLIGDHSLTGMIAEYVSDFENFIKDLRDGNINIAFINIDKVANPELSISRLVEQVAYLCTSHNPPTAHVFIPKEKFNEGIMIKYNKLLKNHFIKINGDKVE